MNGAAPLDFVLAALALGVAVFAVAASRSFAAIVGFVAYGLVLAIVWVRLAAVDVALTEAAIGGLTGVLLLSAAARLRGSADRDTEARPSAGLRAAAALLCAALSAGLALAVLSLPEAAPTLAPEAVVQLPETGLGNPVTAVLMAYRAIDTLLEKFVLLVALLAVWSLAPDAAWRGRPGAPARKTRDDALVFLARVLPPVGIVVGVYLLWTSADHPGGAFQGGTLLAAMWLLARMAGLVPAPAIRRGWLTLALVAGPLVFLAIGLAGFALADGFLAYPVAWAKALIVAIEVPMLLTIAATLAMLLDGPPREVER